MVSVKSADVIAVRLFAVANEIDLPRAEALWMERTGRSGERIRLASTPAEAISFVVPPLALALGHFRCIIDGDSHELGCTARLYDFGIVALSLRLPVRGQDWDAFGQTVNRFDAAIGPAGDMAVWSELLDRLSALVGSAYDRPTDASLQEDYMIALVEQFDEPLSSRMLLSSLDLVPVLSGHGLPLSEGAREDLLRHRFSYYNDDLAVITWDRAFLYEPRGETDVADVLELANAQLLEMRSYDELLNHEMPRMRALTEAGHLRFRALAGRRYARLARRLRALVAEITELTERVENALQVTEDVYLARVYSAAIELMRVPRFGDAVDRKLAIIRETYSALQSEAESSRAELMEIAIIILIAVEILLSLWRH